MGDIGRPCERASPASEYRSTTVRFYRKASQRWTASLRPEAPITFTLVDIRTRSNALIERRLRSVKCGRSAGGSRGAAVGDQK